MNKIYSKTKLCKNIDFVKYLCYYNRVMCKKRYFILQCEISLKVNVKDENEWREKKWQSKNLRNLIKNI